MVTLLAIPILGEKFGWYKMSAVISGFAGIVLIMQPWSSDFNYMLLLPILAAFGYSLARVTSLSFEDNVPDPPAIPITQTIKKSFILLKFSHIPKNTTNIHATMIAVSYTHLTLPTTPYV